MIEKQLIYDLDFSMLQQKLQSWGEPVFRVNQIWRGLYNNLWSTPAQFTNLPKSLRGKIDTELSLSGLQPSTVLTSRDGETLKTLFTLPDNNAIEAVLMHYHRRNTLCISSQAGCALGCVFCATGQMGFKRQLTSGEIIEQVIYYARQLATKSEQATNIVLMGMGEPFLNYDTVMDAIDRLNHPTGMNLGARRFTISTVGIVPMIQRFAKEKRQVNLAISLHAATDQQRSELMPINNKYPIAEIMGAVREYATLTSRRVTFEWALIQGVNDSTANARELGQLLKGLLCHVNAIPLNPTRNFKGRGSSHERAAAFKAELERNGVPCTIRIRRGIDIQAGCGQLATQASKDKNSSVL